MSTPQERPQESPQARIESEVRAALKAGEKERLSTLRMLLNTIQNERIRIGEEIDATAFLGIVRKAIKQRQESAEQFRLGQREELAAREEREAAILEAYLPPPVSDDDLKAAILEILEDQDLTGPAAIGPVMRGMMARFGGQTDGGTINRLAREILAERE